MGITQYTTPIKPSNPPRHPPTPLTNDPLPLPPTTNTTRNPQHHPHPPQPATATTKHPQLALHPHQRPSPIPRLLALALPPWHNPTINTEPLRPVPPIPTSSAPEHPVREEGAGAQSETVSASVKVVGDGVVGGFGCEEGGVRGLWEEGVEVRACCLEGVDVREEGEVGGDLKVEFGGEGEEGRFLCFALGGVLIIRMVLGGWWVGGGLWGEWIHEVWSLLLLLLLVVKERWLVEYGGEGKGGGREMRG